MNTWYKTYLKSNHWKKTRAEVLTNNRRKCRICGSTNNLNLHHKKYRKFNRSVLYKETKSDLRTLCNKCHNLWHKYQNDTVFSSKYADRIRNILALGLDDEFAFKNCKGEKYKAAMNCG